MHRSKGPAGIEMDTPSSMFGGSSPEIDVRRLIGISPEIDGRRLIVRPGQPEALREQREQIC